MHLQRNEAAESATSLLLFQLHETQEKLAQALWEKQCIQEGNSIGSAVTVGPKVRLDEVRKQQPHRHLHFTLEGLMLGESGPWDLEVRLVDHHGRAGLVFFPPTSEAGGGDPFSNWPTDGSENGRPYVLYLAGDKNSMTRLRAAKTAAVLAAEIASLSITQALREDEDFQISRSLTTGEVEFWLLAAERVRSSLKEASERLHYDDVRCKPTKEPKQSIKFTLVNPLRCGRSYDRFAIVWHGALESAAKLRQLTFINAPGKAPIFQSWPLDEQGLPARDVTIDFRSEMWRWVRRMTRDDCALVARVLEELPNFGYHYNAQQPMYPANLQKLRASSRNVLKRWKALLQARGFLERWSTRS
jgi:hypothetical protein